MAHAFPPGEAQSMELHTLAVEALLKNLRPQGLNPCETDGFLHLGLEELAIRLRVGPTSDRGYTCGVELGMELFLDRERRQVIYEPLVGTGQTCAEAAGRAVESWLEGVWPPVRELFRPRADPRVRRLELCVGREADGRPKQWDVVLGPPQVAGEQRQALLERVEGQPPMMQALPTVARHLNGSLHWLKVVLVRRRDGSVEGDVRLDNNTLPGGFEALRQFPWPVSPGYLQYRQFVMIRRLPANPEDAEGVWGERVQSRPAARPLGLGRWWPFRR